MNWAALLSARQGPDAGIINRASADDELADEPRGKSARQPAGQTSCSGQESV